MNLKAVRQWSLETPILACTAVPLRLGSGGIDALALAYSNSAGSNAWIEMFCYPTDTQKIAVFDLQGRLLWKRDLGPGVVPDGCFFSIFPFDLDGDGADELYFINNLDPVHPFAVSKYRLERVAAATGVTTGQWPWPSRNAEGPMHNAFRNVIAGGYVHGRPVLLTAQGMYLDMYLQAWDPGLTPRWEVAIAANAPGARASHMHPVVDLDGDGVDEWLWGERCIDVGSGRERFCADADTYSGHSDVIQPFLDPGSGRWLVYTAREKQSRVAPRVAVYDAQGRRLWGDVDHGHLHIGWVARFAPERRTAMAIRIGSQQQTPQTRMIAGREVFAHDAATGQPLELPFDPFQTIPVDLDGDGLHELVRGTRHNGNCDGSVIDGRGRPLGSVRGSVALASKFLDRPGEQLLTVDREGTIRIWADTEAVDSELALARYRHPFYALSQRASACGNHLHLLGGL